MDYLLKASALIILFYGCYLLFLKGETFFQGNRWFLLSGLVLSVLIPLLVIPIYVEMPAEILTTKIVSNFKEKPSNVITSRKSFDIMFYVLTVYIIGVLFFIGKLAIELLSLFRVIKKQHNYQKGMFRYIENNTPLAPFSFFRWIVYNPQQFSERELKLILSHEQAHARELHSLDILIVQMACAFFWFNPFIWMYKKAIVENLEYIADLAAKTSHNTIIDYQNLLLKASIPTDQLSLTNNFYNSTLKKRILMLHKSKSSSKNVYKYAMVLPLLALFIFNFNTVTIAQTTDVQTDRTKTAQNVLRYVITKDTKDTQLESIKEKLAENKVSISFENLKRNDRKEITGIKILYESTVAYGNHFVDSENPISDIAIAYNVNENNLMVGQAKKNLSQSFEIVQEDGETTVKKEKRDVSVVVYATDDATTAKDSVSVIGKDGAKYKVKTDKNVYVVKSASVKNSDDAKDLMLVRKNKNDTVWIKEDVKNIVFTDDDGNVTPVNANENGNESYTLITNSDEKPLIIVDGKTMTPNQLAAIDKKDYLSVHVLKGDKAIDSYGSAGKDGVIIITTRNPDKSTGIKKDNPWAIKTEITVTDEDTLDNLKSYSTFIITKKSTNDMLEMHKKYLKSKNINFTYSELKRNNTGNIIKLKIELSDEKGTKRSATYSDLNGIVQISMGIKDGQLFLNSEKN